MCGINGILSLNIKNEDKLRSSIFNMNNLIFHRGPDDDGIFVDNNSSFGLAMGMRRLSIIDLNSGKQPISNADKSITIVFNGEIYNYKILRKELISQGVIFKTKSDTEVILKLYEKHGVKSFSKLDGMYAFSIYDKKQKKIIIARDFFGEKPLYYYKNEKGLYWASELKSLKCILPTSPQISNEALSLYFQLTYIPSPYTIYKDVFKLEPNSFLEIDCNNCEFSIKKIESYSQKAIKQAISFKDAKQITKELVFESVKSRAISDVPIGAFLSGGVDSSIVSLALAKKSNVKIDTFSMGFEKKSFDETDKSRTVANLINSNHHEFVVRQKDMQEDIHNVLLNFDEPFADSSALPTYLVSKLTSQHVKVALTGDGGDEVFGGYNKYFMGKFNHKYTSLIPQKFHETLKKISSSVLKNTDDSRGLKFKLNRLIKAIEYNDKFYFNIISLGFQKEELHKLLKEKSLENEVLLLFKGNEPNNVSGYRAIDKRLSLEGDMLVKVDRMSMLNSIECRAPFLNKDIWDFTNSLPDSYLIKGWNKKYLLKESFSEFFPKDFLNKPKQGFGVPVGDWLRTILKEELKSYCESEFLEKQNIFNVNFVNKLIDNHIKGKEDNTFRVWSFFCFQKWYKFSYLS